jgi:glycosyltransferase involved in cell wall biosynthesis
MTRKNSGVGQYISQLLPHLVPRLTAADCEVSLLLAEDADLPGLDGMARIVRLPVVRTKRTWRVFWEHLYVPLVSWSADVYLSLMSVFPFSPVWGRRKLVVQQDIYHVLYQIDPSLYPWECSRTRLLYINRAIKRTLNAADGIITLSQFVADGLHRHLGVATDRITIIPCGVDHRRFGVRTDLEQNARIRKRYGLPERFYLFVGSLALHKNLRLVVDAYAAGGNSEFFFPVAITYQKQAGRLFEATARFIEERGLNDSFRFLGFVPDEDLPLLYRAAQALLYPSFHEGFGIPPLEAMASGTPVVTSNRTAIPEVVGDAALVIDPTEPWALVEALHKVNDELTRQSLIEKGLLRAQAFSWERTAQLMAEVIIA